MRSTKDDIQKNNARKIFNKVLEDKRALSKCIQENGDLKKLTNERGIKFSTPV